MSDNPPTITDEEALPPELELIAKHWPEQIVTDYMPYALAWRNQFPHESKRGRMRYIRIFREWCRVANGQNLTPRLILKWNNHQRNAKRNGTTLNRINGTIRALLGWLKSVGAITVDPSLALARAAKAPVRPVRIFTHAEYEKIVAYGEANADRYATATWLVVLSYHTGLSLVDCCFLKWDEVRIDPDGPCYIQRVRTKMASRMGSRAMCTIPIVVGGELWNWIQRMQKYNRRLSEYVHPEGPEFYENLRREPKRVFKQMFNAALGGWGKRDARTFKCLRNTFCSRLLNAGVESVLVAKMTGHNRLDQLAAYVTPDIRTMQDAVVRGLRFVQQPTETITLKLPSTTENENHG